MMKKAAVFLLVLGSVSLVQAAVTGSVLFSDNYNRSNNTDIDASSTGMSGTLSPMVYQEAFEGSGQLTSIQILSNQLNVAVGAGMSSLYLNHNFTDAGILSADGFSVSLDVVTITSADDPGNRFGGFGVGNTQAEAQAAQDSFDSLVPFRPNLARANQGIGVSDFYVDLALDQNLRLWSNGSLLNTINVGAVSGTIKVDFLLSDFNVGSSVTAAVYFNGVQQDVQTFTWDNNGANYLGISGRTAGAGVFLDNLSIATIYEDRAHTPSPINGAELVDAGGLTVSWYKGKDASGNPNSLIAQHYFYVRAGEPNFVDVTPITVADTVDPVSSSDYSFASDMLYYWRVDESINGSSATDPNTITGYVWSFDTYTFPIINADPGQAVAAPAETAVLTCDFTSVTDPTAKWFKSGNPDVEMITGGDITINVTNTGGTAYTSSLTIDNVEVADEGMYYCLVENAGGPQNAVTSATGSLGVKRKVAHWTFDQADLQGGQYLDISGEGHNADPNIVPGSASFVDGVDPTETGDGLDLTVQPLAAADSNDWAPSMYTGEITVSAWLNWAGTNGNWQGVVSNRVAAPPATYNFYVEIRQDNGNLQIGGIPGVGDLQIPPLPVGEWVHLAITVHAGEVVIYLNGEALAANTAGQAVTQNLAPLYIGALNRNVNGTVVSIFNGVLDDVQIYNYALSNTEVADLYYEVLETPVCLNPDALDLQLDVAGGGVDGDQPDCLVTLTDFAAFAQAWLNCGLYPQSECK